MRHQQQVLGKSGAPGNKACLHGLFDKPNMPDHAPLDGKSRQAFSFARFAHGVKRAVGIAIVALPCRGE